MTLRDISLVIALIAIFISFIPFLKTLYEDYGLPAWRLFETVYERLKELIEKYNVPTKLQKDLGAVTDERLEELIEKYNVPTELQKKLGAVTDKYFLIEGFFDRCKLLHYYWIFIRQPDGSLGEKKGVLTFCKAELRAFPLTRRGLDELNYMCDAEVINGLRNEDA